MRRLMLGILLCLVAGSAAAAVSETQLRIFIKGRTTLSQVVGVLGNPDKTEYTDEGLRAIAYLPAGTAADKVSVLGLFTVAGGAIAAPGTAALEFDRAGRLLYWVAIETGTGGPRRVTSEDGAAPLPVVTVTLDDQARAALKFVDDGKAHLGVQLAASDAQPKEKAEFDAAKFQGMIVANLLPGSAADRAGLKVGDYLYVLNGYLVTSNADVVKAMNGVTPGDAVKARVRRIDEASRTVSELVLSVKF